MSCGGSGLVRLWNTAHSRLVGQFAAHNKDLGSIVMTVSPCGKYLVTADREGTLKTWDIQVSVRHTRPVLYVPTAGDTFVHKDLSPHVTMFCV